MLFKDFSEKLEVLEKTSSRNIMVEKLASLIKNLEVEESALAIYLLQGRVCPLYEPLEFNLSTKSVLKVLNTFNNNANNIYSNLGDIGLTAEAVLSKNTSANLSLEEAFYNLKSLAKIIGKNSQTKKTNVLTASFQALNSKEAKYFARIIVGKLRLGLSDKSIIDAVSVFLVGDKSEKEMIQHAFGVRSDMGSIVLVAKDQGLQGLRSIKAKIGVPIAPKLVEREKDFAEIFKRLDNHYIQPKYDGLRAQIHYSKKGFKIETVEKDIVSPVRIFSRRLEDLTLMFPDLTNAFDNLGLSSFILDAEIIGFKKKSGDLLSFAKTMQRKRKTSISAFSKEVPVKAFCFDILLLDNQSLLKTALQERIKILNQVIKVINNNLIVSSETTLVNSVLQGNKLFKKYLDMNLEGIIAKGKATFYDPGTRNFDWIKLKGAMNGGLADTIDAVVLGYYFGTGTRAKFGIGAILIGVYDNELEKFVGISKVGTGITDDQFKLIKSKLDNYVLKSVSKNVSIAKDLIPDVIVSPDIVAVVEADSISRTKLPNAEKHKFSLRFPRLKVFDRKDKLVNQITSLSELAGLFNINK